jgi:hypothetical protein
MDSYGGTRLSLTHNALAFSQAAASASMHNQKAQNRPSAESLAPKDPTQPPPPPQSLSWHPILFSCLPPVPSFPTGSFSSHRHEQYKCKSHFGMTRADGISPFGNTDADATGFAQSRQPLACSIGPASWAYLGTTPSVPTDHQTAALFDSFAIRKLRIQCGK